MAFTHTLNLATDDAHMAARMMAYTAMHQSEIKLAAGGEAKGRKLALPVYAYSLAWHPTEAPTREEMIEAAHQSLKTLDLDGHEIFMAAHNDQDHPHIHVIVNRVHPETGIAAPLSKDLLRLSTWAEEYERERGQIFCDRRVENNERRRNAEWVKDRESQHAAAYHRWRSEQTRQRVERSEKQLKGRSALHKKQHQILAADRDRRITQSRVKLKALNRPQWAALYRRHERERQQFAQSQRSAWRRLRHYLKNRDPWDVSGTRAPLRGVVAGAFQAIVSDKNASRTFEQKQKRERKTTGERVNAQTRKALQKINTDHERDTARLIARQRREREATKKAHRLQSEKAARDLASGKAREEFDRQNRYRVFREMQEHKREQDAKARREAAKDSKRRETRAAFAQNRKEITHDREAARDEQEKAKPKRAYRAFRDMKEQTGRDRAARQKDKDTRPKRAYRAFRDMKEEGQDKGRDTDKGRDNDRGREPDPRKPPNPSKNDL